MIAETANSVGDRCAWWFRAHGLSAKEVGRLIGASEGTGKRLRSGVAPTTEQLTKLSRHFGWAFVNFVMEAVIGPSDAVLAAELDDINRCLERLEKAMQWFGRTMQRFHTWRARRHVTLAAWWAGWRMRRGG